ncbi:hypothetical protein L208DRAFT_1253457, partial [Tricholoma matsutake]
PYNTVKPVHAALCSFALQTVEKILVKEAEGAWKSDASPQVVSNAISLLIFCRSENAGLLPLARGMLYFASLVPSDLYSISSHLGETPVYSTVYNAMQALSAEEEHHCITCLILE